MVDGVDLAVADDVFGDGIEAPSADNAAFGGEGIYEEFRHDRLDFTPDAKIFTYEMNRIGQALRVAGIDPAMLNSMQRSQVVRALMVDSTLFEEGGAMYKLLRQTHGIRDAVSLTDAEKAEQEKTINTQPALSEEEKAELERNWELRRKNLASLMLTVGGLYAANASDEAVETEVQNYQAATPDYPGQVNSLYHHQRPIPEQMLPMRGAVRNRLNGLSDVVSTLAQNLDGVTEGFAQDIQGESWVNIPKGGWVQHIQAQSRGRGGGMSLN